MIMKIGQIVLSKKGRDKGKAFIVMAAEGEYVFLADGKLRPLTKPKKKKVRHIQPTNTVVDLVTATGGLKNADLKKWLAAFVKKECVC
jgi:ribosomal protein L14E/L6E/L27E